MIPGRKNRNYNKILFFLLLEYWLMTPTCLELHIRGLPMVPEQILPLEGQFEQTAALAGE